MPKATVTVRELRNKDTGIDLSVTSYRELPGLVRSTFEFQIVVVSNLACFKLPSHKDTDVVQFTLFKKFAEFEDLRAKLNEAFSGTALPLISKKSIIVNDTVIKERRNSLDSFLKFLSSTPRIITSSQVLTFLGVEPQKAKRFASGELDETSARVDSGGDVKGDNDGNDTDQAVGEQPANSLFEEEEEEEEEEDFLTSKDPAAGDEDEDEDFFSATDSASASNTRMFEGQDLKRDLTEDDEQDFTFIPDAIVTKREVVTVATEDNNDDLLNVDPDVDFEKLLTLEGKRQTNEHRSISQQEEKPEPFSEKPKAANKPNIPSKPKPSAKPTISQKPTVPSKPGTENPKPAVPQRPPRSPDKVKPVPAQRPKPAPRKLKPQGTDAEKRTEEGEKSSEASTKEKSRKPDLSSDDIMQYIAANTSENDADLDLFS